MDNVVSMAIIECGAHLTGELARDTLTETSMTDDVVEHLPSVDVLRDHVIMICVYDKLSHATDVWMVQEHAQRRFADRSDLLRGVLRRLFCLLLG